MVNIAFYGGSFDPPHIGHLTIARNLVGQFRLDELVFVPAFRAPHKKRSESTSVFDRFAMLCMATASESDISVSKIEIELPAKPYTVETLTRLTEILRDVRIFFVMGADSWAQIRTWREWEKVLTMTDQIVVTRPGFPISFDHVTEEIRERIIDLRDLSNSVLDDGSQHIYVSGAAEIDISATGIRQQIRDGDDSWRHDVPIEVANYIKKYQIYS